MSSQKHKVTHNSMTVNFFNNGHCIVFRSGFVCFSGRTRDIEDGNLISALGTNMEPSSEQALITYLLNFITTLSRDFSGSVPS